MCKSFLFVLITFLILSFEYVQGQSYQPAIQQNANNWKLLGCANDLYPNARALNSAYSESPNGQSTSIDSCLQYCQAKGAYLAGLEDGYQCFCGTSLDNGAMIQIGANQISSSNHGDCSSSCKGNSNQNCGGQNALLIFQTTQHGPPTVQNVTNQNYLGCYADSVNNRLLPFVYQGNPNPSMTPALCASGCANHGYDLSGTEYRYQCFCGSSNSVSLGSSLSGERCESTCTGDNTAICGGPGALTVYQGPSNTHPTPNEPEQLITSSTNGYQYAYQGCFQDGSSPRTLRGPNFSDPAMTEEKCVQFCSSQSGNLSRYAGLEYSTECYCGAILHNTNTASNCNMGCAGDSTETCGGGYALSLFKIVT